jgi:phage-related protein
MPKSGDNRELVWLSGEVKSPPFSKRARIETGFLLRKLQEGEVLAMPFSRPMPSIGKNCHELRVIDQNKAWRIIYRIDSDAIIILEVFQKKTRETPKHIIETCKKRLRFYDSL